jgi:TetR/AcrR family transcriptional repressor of nem operon
MSESETKTRILDSAQDLIQRLGANGMSYRHISDAVGIRKASIHHHFPTKETLIEALLTRYSRYFFDLVDSILASDAAPREKLERYVGLFESTLQNNNCDKACLCGMLGAEITTLGLESSAKVKSFYEGNEERLARILEEGREKNVFRFKGTAQAAAALIFALLEGAVLIARAKDGVGQFRLITDQLYYFVEG